MDATRAGDTALTQMLAPLCGPTYPQLWVVFDQGPAVVVHAMTSVHQQLAQVPGRHVRENLHHFACPIFTKDFNILQHTKGTLPGEHLRVFKK